MVIPNVSIMRRSSQSAEQTITGPNVVVVKMRERERETEVKLACVCNASIEFTQTKANVSDD